MNCNLLALPLIVIVGSIISCGPSSPPVLESVRYGPNTVEERISIKGVPVFKDYQDRVGLEINTPENHEIWPLIWPEDQIPYRKLESGKPFRFEILRNVDLPDSIGGTGFSSLLRVSDSGKILYDASFCEIHHTRMTRKLEVGDDPSAYTRRFNRIRWSDFPNDGRVSEGCCGYHPPMGAWVCDDCVRISERERSRSLLN